MVTSMHTGTKTQPSDNRLLGSLTGAEYERLLPHLHRVSLQLGDVISDAADRLTEEGLSQLPVMEGKEVVGTVNESLVMQRLYRDPGIATRPVAEIMEPPLPVLDIATELDEVYLQLSGGAAPNVGGEDRVQKAEEDEWRGQQAQELQDKVRNRLQTGRLLAHCQTQ